MNTISNRDDDIGVTCVLAGSANDCERDKDMIVSKGSNNTCKDRHDKRSRESHKQSKMTYFAYTCTTRNQHEVYMRVE